MDIPKIITHLRKYAPVFENRVGGAAAWGAASELTRGVGVKENGNMPVPAAYVIPLEDSAEPNESMNALYQQVTERVAVIIQVDNSGIAGGDRLGQGSVDQVESVKYLVHRALLNWQMDTERSSMSLMYGGGRLLFVDRARLFWQLEYELPIQLQGDVDGFVEPSEPLTKIDITDPNFEGFKAEVVLEQ